MGNRPLLDVMHFGTPLWSSKPPAIRNFPEALERFTEAMVTRYAPASRPGCPCNEPRCWRCFSGDFGSGRRTRASGAATCPWLTRIVQRSEPVDRAIRRAQPQATVLHCDNVENYKSRDPGAGHRSDAGRNLRRFLVLDLLMGRLDRHHPLFNWVTSYGMSELIWTGSAATRDARRAGNRLLSALRLAASTKSATACAIARSESPIGLYGIGHAYYNRYGLR